MAISRVLFAGLSPSGRPRLRKLAADAERGRWWRQRARTNGLVRLDLTNPDQLELLRRYGTFTNQHKGVDA